ncbi:hypothetical protein BD779DRAFT_1672463 [Infundibulicybe gibba]|nr:hypothetical protein BD779DRAFT_1672463 [Infundibulicybe gibba]
MSTVSPHNPFRGSDVSPNPTGTATPPASNAQSQPTDSSAGGTTSTRPATSAAPPEDPTGLTDEAPPAYTIGPDVYQGEATLEYGPSRPFQPPPGRPPVRPLAQPSQPITPQPTGWQNMQNPHRPQTQVQSLWQQITTQIINPILNPPPTNTSNTLTPQPTGSGWSAYPGYRPPPGPPPRPGLANLPPPPPRHPSSPNNHPQRTTSEFAQDFYAAGPGQTPPEQSPQPAPPQPPPVPLNRPTAPQIPDDGRPTEVPTPGHPLLHEGKLLVYPSSYECEKCANTGYKRNDPKNPCRKCWSKYAKPFSGALAYTPFSPPSASTPAPPSGSKSFQRPLPYQAPPPIPPQQQYRPPPGPSQHHYNQPPYHPNAPRQFQHISAYAPPPPGALVYPAGDPRIGGRLCWQCDGKGRIGFLIFEEACEACGGIGRVFH